MRTFTEKNYRDKLYFRCICIKNQYFLKVEEGVILVLIVIQLNRWKILM